MTKTFNWLKVFNLLGLLLLLEALFMLSAVGVALYYGEEDWLTTLISVLITAGFGGLFVGTSSKSKGNIGTREGYLLVGFIWIFFSFFGMLPFMLDHRINTVTDAFFETMAGFTTTGATILTDVESMPHGLLYWRALTQWLGGLGIVVLFLSFLPSFGSNMRLYAAEMSGPTHSKILPRTTDTARVLWGLYILLTVACVIALWFGGMGLFDAVCHAFTTLATGGFSTKNSSIAFWNSPTIELIILIFMFIGGINFTLMYGALFKFRLGKLFKDEEFRTYILISFVAFVVLFAILFLNHRTFEISDLRGALFMATSFITTTGFSNAPYATWPSLAVYMLMIISFVGAMAGSTTGSTKVIRIQIIIKNIYYELRRITHPRAVVPLRINKHIVADNVVYNTYTFIITLILAIILFTAVLMMLGMGGKESFYAVVASINNIGSSFGPLGVEGNYASIPMAAKWLLSFLMLLGRLEIFTVLLLFTPQFWRK